MENNYLKHQEKHICSKQQWPKNTAEECPYWLYWPGDKSNHKHLAVGLFSAQFHNVDLKSYLFPLANLDLEPRYSLDDTHRKPLKATSADSTYGGK